MAGFFRRVNVLGALALACGALSAVSCGSEANEPPPYDRESIPTPPAPASDAAPPPPIDANPCGKPATGCPCEVENQTVVCGTVHDEFGDYVRCSPAYMHCISGVWGECMGDRVVGAR